MAKLKVRFSAAFLALTLAVVASGCSGAGGGETTVSAAPQVSSTSVAASASAPAKYGSGTEYMKSWNTSLPVGFPQKPEDADIVSVKVMPYEAFKSDYASEYLRIKMRCDTKQMALFSNDMKSSGYVGGFSFKGTQGKDSEIFVANWSNGKYFVTSSACEYKLSSEDNLNYTVTLDVVQCVNKLPAEINEYMPVFDGFTAQKGKYIGADMTGAETSVFNGFENAVYWKWEFTGKNAIYGVTPGALNAYTQLLEDVGYKVPGETENDGSGDCYYFGAEKVDDAGEIYGIYIQYTAYTSTMEIIYTNNVSYFFGGRSEG